MIKSYIAIFVLAIMTGCFISSSNKRDLYREDSDFEYCDVYFDEEFTHKLDSVLATSEKSIPFSYWDLFDAGMLAILKDNLAQAEDVGIRNALCAYDDEIIRIEVTEFEEFYWARVCLRMRYEFFFLARKKDWDRWLVYSSRSVTD